MSRFKKKKKKEKSKLPYRRSQQNYKCIYEICTQNENLFNPIILLIREEAVILSSRFIPRTLIINSWLISCFLFLTLTISACYVKSTLPAYSYTVVFFSPHRVISCRQKIKMIYQCNYSRYGMRYRRKCSMGIEKQVHICIHMYIYIYLYTKRRK